ncbi:hypothetical protein [Flavobacterium columnare]|uniref:hypothetical protein n=1 Tax=Flavobacterium columnare TaxID=996 RepID=UPI0013E3C879|nr:hypothetical protein [Flavobacterium columnare]
MKLESLKQIEITEKEILVNIYGGQNKKDKKTKKGSKKVKSNGVSSDSTDTQKNDKY